MSEVSIQQGVGLTVARIRRSPELIRAFVIAVVIYGYFAFRAPGFATVNNMFTIVEGLVFLGLAALAFGLTMIAGELDLSVPATATVAGVFVLKFTDSILEGLLIGIAIGLVIGLLQGLLVWAVRLHSVVITLGTSTALIGISKIVSGNATIVSKDLELSDQISHRMFIFSPASLLAILFFIICGLGLTHTRYGAEIRAIGGGRNEALAAGVPLWRPTIVVFGSSGFLSGMLGALVSISVGSVNPISFNNVLLAAVGAALIGGVSLYGGRGTALGIAVGTLTLRFVISGMNLGGNKWFVINMAIGVLLLFVVALELAASRGVFRRMMSSGREAKEPSAA
jgi:ribose transport system permease protein